MTEKRKPEKGNDAMLPQTAPERIEHTVASDRRRWWEEQAQVDAQPVEDDPTPE